MKITNANCATLFYLTVLAVQVLLAVLKLTVAHGMPWMLMLMPLIATAVLVVIAGVVFVIEILRDYGEDER